MTIQSVTVDLPTSLYNRLKRQAEQAQRSIEAEVLEAVAVALPADEDLSPDLRRRIAVLATADDEMMWLAVKGYFPKDKAERLELLHLQRQAGDWNDKMAQEAEELTAEMEQFMLLRAQAMSFLMQRGHDISALAGQ